MLYYLFRVTTDKMKTQTLSIFAIFTVLVLTSFALADGEEFYITDKTSCTDNGDYVVMGLTATTNAHGELASEGNYDTVLCANFESDFSCNGDNEIIRLTSETNANAQSGDYDNVNNGIYPVEVCYGDIDYRSTTDECNLEGEFEVFR